MNMLNTYRELVDILFSNKSCLEIPSKSIDHIKIINQMIVKHTPNNGDVFSLQNVFLMNIFLILIFLVKLIMHYLEVFIFI